MDLPARFVSQSESNADDDVWKARLKDKEIEIGIPTAFGGSGEGLSPEDLFVGSVLECFIATFKTVAERSPNFSYQSIHGQAEGVVDPDETGTISVSRVELDIEVATDSESKVRSIIKTTRNHCFIHNSITSDVTIDYTVV